MDFRQKLKDKLPSFPSRGAQQKEGPNYEELGFGSPLASPVFGSSLNLPLPPVMPTISPFTEKTERCERERKLSFSFPQRSPHSCDCAVLHPIGAASTDRCKHQCTAPFLEI